MSETDSEDTEVALKELAATDLELVRVIEDLNRILADRDSALPIRIRRLLERRRELRDSIH